jgi:hypothetical protein
MRLLDDLDGVFWALGFACSANKTVVGLGGDGLSVVYLENADGTSVFACSASSAFVVIDYNLDH